MIFFREDAILASSTSKFGKWVPLIDRDDFQSSTESTISTSLTHNNASEGKLEQELSWILNLIFQHENVEGVGIYQNEAPRFAVFADQPWNSVVYPLERKNSWLKVFLQNSASELCFQIVRDKSHCTPLPGDSTCSTLIRTVTNSLIKYL